MRNLVVLFVLCLLARSVLKAEDVEGNLTLELYKDVIADELGNDWIIKAWGSRLGTNDDCTQGASWIFFDNGELIIRSCLNGKVEEQSHSWAIEKSVLGIIELLVDDTFYWIEILTEKIEKDGHPPQEILSLELQRRRDDQSESSDLIRLKRNQPR